MGRFVAIFFGLLIMVDNCGAEDLPKEVQAITSAVNAVPGITEAEVGKTYLPDVKVEHLSLPGTFADLPIGILRRSSGAIGEELLISIDFRIQRDEKGLKGLEFLSWWVRDQSRGGEKIQIRSIGLPPSVGGKSQLGSTLRFRIEWFYIPTSESTIELLKNIEKKAADISQALSLYREAF